MSRPSSTPAAPVASAEKVLRELFLTLFLRGRTSRGLTRKGAPRSIAHKLALTLLFHALFGAVAAPLYRQPIFALSAYLHALTFTLLGMFIASSAGTVLFNKEESEILLHRPVSPQVMLRAKIHVLLSVSGWLAMAFNLVGFVVGVVGPNGSWRFPLAHGMSLMLEVLFCTATVVLVFQLCLRWLGRERLENIMTTSQIAVSIGAVLAGQLVPNLMARADGSLLSKGELSVWIACLPPAWFAGITDLIVDGWSTTSFLLSTAAVGATCFVSWMAFHRLAAAYEKGVQALGEMATSGRRKKSGRRWLEVFVGWAPLRWCLRDSVTRATFLLSAAYFTRDRDMKLRLYPGLAPLFVLPLVMLLPGNNRQDTSGFMTALCGAYTGITPLLAISILQHSNQWQATDIFRLAPIAGPGPICAGARQAVLWFLVFPVLITLTLFLLAVRRDFAELPLILPGMLLMPIYLLLPNVRGHAIPMSLPADNSQEAGRGVLLVGVMFVSFIVAGVAVACWYLHILWYFLAVEALIVGGVYRAIRYHLDHLRWNGIE